MGLLRGFFGAWILVAIASLGAGVVTFLNVYGYGMSMTGGDFAWAISAFIAFIAADIAIAFTAMLSALIIGFISAQRAESMMDDGFNDDFGF